jgi:hypothetical protein
MAASPAPAVPGRKRRFLMFGCLNVAVTNTALQLLLRVVPIGLATFLSQLINGALGYVFLGKGVVRVDRLERRSAAAYALVSPLPVISYGLQMRFVSRSLLAWRGGASSQPSGVRLHGDGGRRGCAA